jgi:hypothetical protein
MQSHCPHCPCPLLSQKVLSPLPPPLTPLTPTPSGCQLRGPSASARRSASTTHCRSSTAWRFSASTSTRARRPPPSHGCSRTAASPSHSARYTLFRKQARNEPIGHRTKRTRSATYTEADKELVCKAQDDHNDWHYDQLQLAWKEANPDSTRCPCNHTIHKWLKEAGFTDKLLIPVPQARNAPFNIDARKEYCTRASALDRDTLVFIDETSFDRNLHSSRGRSRKGTVATYQALNSPGPGMKVCAALSPALGLVMYAPQLTPWNGDDFARFMTRLCALPEMQQQSMRFVVDNVRLHHTEVVKDALRARAIQHEMLYLPTYSPHLNPIEYCFHNWKTEIKHVDQLHDRRRLQEQIDDTRTCITAHLVTRILDQVYQYYTHCIQGKPLEEFTPIGNRVQRVRQEADRQRQRGRRTSRRSELVVLHLYHTAIKLHQLSYQPLT